MKKKLMLLLGTMLILAIIGAFIITILNPTTDTEAILTDNKLKVVTTFYPVYMIGMNIADQVEEIEVKSLTELNTGCLHDYQLTTEDMKIIASADVMIINGGGMEGFLEEVASNYPKLTIINASQDITMLQNEVDDKYIEETEEEHLEALEEDSEHNHGEFNPHVWLDPKLYVEQIETIRDGLLEYLKDTNSDFDGVSEDINSNAELYINKVLELDTEIEVTLENLAQSSKQNVSETQAVIFHDAFAYLANRVGLKIAFTVPLDSDTALSAGDIAEIIDAVREDKIKYLFTEQQYSDSIAKRIEAETEAKMYIIDSMVTGDGTSDSYLKAMHNNLLVLKEALTLQ